MKLQYNKQDDILVIKLSTEPYDYAEIKDNIIVHYDKAQKPVLIEVLNASHSLNTTNNPPQKSKTNFLSAGAQN